MKCTIISLWLLVGLTVGDQDSNFIGPFGKRHTIGDEPSVYAPDRPTNLFAPSTTLTAVTLNVSKNTYSNNEQITVSWTPLVAPCAHDYVGVYFADTPVINASAYIDYEYVQSNQSTVTWQMINFRRALDFRYYSRNDNCSGTRAFIAQSSIIEPLNYNEPTHIHIAYSDRIDQMYVSYLTNSSQYIPQCQYGLSPTCLNFVQNGSTTTYKASDMCEEGAIISGPHTFIDPGFMHTMILEDLRPSITYYYRVGTNEHGWSAIYSFTNRPADKKEEVNIIAYGDLGVAAVEPGANSTIDRVTARILSTNVTCLLHIGDISYARGVGALWDKFMIQIQPIAARVPYMTGIGNHEYDHETGGEKDPSHAPGPGGFRPGWGDYGLDSGGECAVPMVHRFHSPSNGNSLFWYSFDVGPVHVLFFSTEHDFRSNATQYKWIENDLRSVNRSKTPWLVIGSHRQMYTTEVVSAGETQISTMLQLYLEPLFYQYHANVYLVGHRHLYERTCAMYQNKCVSDGITHAVIGMAGAELSKGKHSQADWSIYHDEEFGYTTIYANQTYLHFAYYHDCDDQVADQFSLCQ